AVATYKPEMFKDIFGPTTNTISTSVSAPKRFGSSLKKMNIPKKKKIVEDSQGPVNIMDDINKTINKQEEASYECPFCFEELVPPYPEELRKAIEETKKKQSMLEETQRKNYETKVIKEKAEGKVYIEPFMLDKESLSEHDRKIVCHMHKMELELKPLARERGYPEHIDFDSLKSRIEGFKSDLLDIIHGQVESDYFLEEKRKIKQLGANKARDTAELINYFQHTLPGYYGMKGMEIIMKIVGDLFLEKELDKSKCHPLRPFEYIQRVLVPECGIRLIEKDMKVDKKKAKKIMEESIEFGKKYSL
ncbi:hypothetical protein CU098_009933, partial [Rhizopus stolonifer]